MTTPIIKNLLHVVRRFRLATILNVLGLSVAFAAFMIIMMQLNFHFGFDRFHKEHDKIFRLEATADREGEFLAVLNRPLAELFIQSSPHIVGGTLISSRLGEAIFFHVENNGVRNYFRENRARVTPGFTDVFMLDFVEGTSSVFQTPGNVMIPLSMARRLFGNESAIGRHLVFDEGYVTVGAVFRDFPVNSTLRNVIYSAIPEEESAQNWGNWHFLTYIRVNNASNAAMLVDNFVRNFDFEAAFGADTERNSLDMDLRLTALADTHFITDVKHGSTENPMQTMMILFAIGIAILIIAAINFTNFSTALTPMRIRNINTQRVMGAQQRTIRWILVIEAVAFSFVSYLVAILLVNLFSDSMLANLVDADLSLVVNFSVVALVALVAIVIGIVAGLYPSRYMTSFAPALALKGNFAMSPKGKRLRNTLIGIQFVASFILIIGASFMHLQNRFMQNMPLGYDADALITVDINRILGSRDAFTHRLNEFSGIANITYAQQILTCPNTFTSWGRNHQGETITFQVVPVHYTFLQTMGIELTDGRHFRHEDNAERGVFIFNETARRTFNLELNTNIDGIGEIVGFMPDLKLASSRIDTRPMAFFVWGTNWGGVLDPYSFVYIQLRPGTSFHAAMAHVRSTLAEFDPNYPFNVRFHDEVLQRLYERERSLGLLILIFSLIAILISIVGVFGLVVFDSECRRKEIGIRKVMGATALEIVAMFNKAYIKILLICFVLAVPVSWIAVGRWLENFAYRTTMYWWVYLLAFVVVAVITMLTVTIQNWRVANEDPVKSIKTE